jgi:hypothetical protein
MHTDGSAPPSSRDRRPPREAPGTAAHWGLTPNHVTQPKHRSLVLLPRHTANKVERQTHEQPQTQRACPAQAAARVY